jgi:hypothetical protein
MYIIQRRYQMMKLINEILKYPDCPHCGDEWEYQCGECEKEEEDMKSHWENVDD